MTEMEMTGIWSSPVEMENIAPPEMFTSGEYVCQTVGGGVKMLRCLRAEGRLTLPGSFSGVPLVSIGAGAMSNCARLTHVVMPNGLRSIGDYAFFQCSALSVVYVPPTVEHIGEDVFEGTENLVLAGAEGSAIHLYAQSHEHYFLAADGPEEL